jgi:pimeloyl-ACP methyl ester carboxylesterase
MDSLRKYGKEPYSVAVVHGGPGAAGEMAPVARELSGVCGILEPLQSSLSIEGQVRELYDILIREAHFPVTLIGHSWGAWLCLIFASRFPKLVKRSILIGCGPLEEKYAEGIMKARLDRLNDNDRKEAIRLKEALGRPVHEKGAFERFGELMSKADSFDRIMDVSEKDDTIFLEDVFQSIWKEASGLRTSGMLLSYAEQASCPIVAIHGDHDPHPAEGIRVPLEKRAKGFKLIILEKCGHQPWMERQARSEFFRAIKEEL